MNKTLIIMTLMLLALISAASAATVTLDSLGVLANNSYQTSATVTPNFKVIGNASTWNCRLYSNENGSIGLGSWREIQTDSGVSNNTNTSFSTWTLAEIQGTTYCWDVFCNSSSDYTGDWGGSSNVTKCNVGSMNFSVDITNPAITVNGPSNAIWDTDGFVFFNITVVDTNTAQCILYSNLNSSTNYTGNWANKQTYSYTNNTWLNFTFNQLNKWVDNNTGAYLWYIYCNDSAARSTTVGNYTFYVDTVAPSAFDFNLSLFKTDNRFLWNNTYATDYTPQIGWNATVELNFSKYVVTFYRDNYGNETYSQINITTQTTLYTSITTLIGDYLYKIMVTAYDLAGNQKNMTPIDYYYRTDSTNRELKAGWNIIGNPGNNFSLSNLLNWTGATTVSIWNSSHLFQSHVRGGSYGDVQVNPGEAALVYLSADTTFSDLIWNTTAIPTGTSTYSYQAQNITNNSNSNWNLVMMRDWNTNHNLSSLDKFVNCNAVGSGCVAQQNNATFVDYFSAYNNSASTGSKYIPFVANWSINNMTLHFGNCVWLYMSTENNVITINWTAVN